MAFMVSSLGFPVFRVWNFDRAWGFAVKLPTCKFPSRTAWFLHFVGLGGLGEASAGVGVKAWDCGNRLGGRNDQGFYRSLGRFRYLFGLYIGI